jgi:hypothetical protein
VHQGVDPAHADIFILSQVIGCVELGGWIFALTPAGLDVMHKGAEVLVFNFRVGLDIVVLIEQTALADEDKFFESFIFYVKINFHSSANGRTLLIESIVSAYLYLFIISERYKALGSHTILEY